MKEPIAQVVSVVIRARNAASDLAECLPALRNQDLPDGMTLEIIVVDNESTDETVEIAEQYGANIVSIGVNEFSWGRALNRGIAAANGDIVLLLSADATPNDDCWMQRMIAHFSDPKVAAVYGRQSPRRDAPIDEWIRLRRQFDATPQRCSHVAESDVIPASNACAAIRRSVWTESPYDESLEGAEDRVWTNAILRDGYIAVYEPQAEVLHSHNDPPLRLACREWELYVKDMRRQDRPVDFLAALRCLGVLTRRRLRHCLTTNAPLRTKHCGLIRLPIDLGALVAAQMSNSHRQDRSAVRAAMWG